MSGSENLSPLTRTRRRAAALALSFSVPLTGFSSPSVTSDKETIVQASPLLLFRYSAPTLSSK
ncbi:hypothetical protein A2U01_0015814, partial [Trifolium medium]|nr:hypothetical protein [Trifolium medium]